jgi:hypothetical protein
MDWKGPKTFGSQSSLSLAEVKICFVKAHEAGMAWMSVPICMPRA